MKELLAAAEHRPYTATRGMVFIDTCAIIDAVQRDHEKVLLPENAAFLSFNVEELLHVERHLHDEIKKGLRHLFKKGGFLIVDVPVHPGDREGERAFVESIDPVLLQDIHDPSDAVLIAAAIATQSDVITKDKHHLFTAILENHLNQYSIHVWKELKDVEET